MSHSSPSSTAAQNQPIPELKYEKSSPGSNSQTEPSSTERSFGAIFGQYTPPVTTSGASVPKAAQSNKGGKKRHNKK